MLGQYGDLFLEMGSQLWQAGDGNVKLHGAVGDGVADDYAIVQDALNTYAGKRVYFPPGVYNVSQGLELPPNTELVLSANATVRATAAMAALLRTEEALDYSDTHRNTKVEGGIWDCAGLATVGMYFKHFEMFRVQNVDIVDADLLGICLGSASAPSASYEAFIKDFRIRRTIAAGAAQAAGTVILLTGLLTE
jgi:hypothetical protein